MSGEAKLSTKIARQYGAAATREAQRNDIEGRIAATKVSSREITSTAKTFFRTLGPKLLSMANRAVHPFANGDPYLEKANTFGRAKGEDTWHYRHANLEGAGSLDMPRKVRADVLDLSKAPGLKALLELGDERELDATGPAPAALVALKKQFAAEGFNLIGIGRVRDIGSLDKRDGLNQKDFVAVYGPAR